MMGEKKLLADGTFLEQLVAYDKDNMPPFLYEGLQEWLEDPTFTPEVCAFTCVSAVFAMSPAEAVCLFVRVARV